MYLDERKQKVLRAIVHDYVATAEPVGSRSIARKYNLGVSSATIRNEMADLEEMGLIEQPYTSAGRVPSNTGYRYYVDYLMQRVSLTFNEEDIIQENLQQRIKQIEEIIYKTARLLSDLTDYMSLVIRPCSKAPGFQRLQLVPLSENNLLAIIISEGGIVDSRVINLFEPVTADELDFVARVFNDRMSKVSSREVTETLLQELYNELSHHRQLYCLTKELLDEVLKKRRLNENRVCLGGTLNILNQPEYRDVEKIKTLLRVVEEEDILNNLMSEVPIAGISIKIGEENKYPEIQECSLITATYRIKNGISGSIGILGPTRMEYSKTVALMEYISSILEELLEPFY